jgi:hypothetical protein
MSDLEKSQKQRVGDRRRERGGHLGKRESEREMSAVWRLCVSRKRFCDCHKNCHKTAKRQRRDSEDVNKQFHRLMGSPADTFT